MCENTAIDQLCNLPLFFDGKKFQFLDEARLQASVPLCVDGEKVALGRVCEVNQVQARGGQPGVQLGHGEGGILLVTQSVISLNIPPHVTYIVLDPVQKLANNTEQNLHVEKVVLFV